MTSHRWQVETSESETEVFVCVVCGCGGGVTTEVTTKEPRPYMRIASIPVSDDCLVAQQQTKFYVLGRLYAFQVDSIHRKNEAQRAAAWLLEQAIERSPKATDFSLFLRAFYESLTPIELRQRLVVAGFHVPPASQ